MKFILIAGLGNPGQKYEHTRHNIGFRVVDALAEKHSASFIDEEKYKSQTSAFDYSPISPPYQGGDRGGVRVILAKPQTFMNRSGETVLLIKKFFKIANSDILVVHDEIDLPLGTLRFSSGSGPAGHNGVSSVIENLGRNFSRLRVGIENRAEFRQPETEQYVLQNFTAEEEQRLYAEIIPVALQKIQEFLKIEN